MTDEDWLAVAHPYELLQFMRRRTSLRKLRLAACACCRRIWPLLVDERSRKAVEMSELYADGIVTKQEMSGAQSMAASAVKTSLEKEGMLPERYTKTGSVSKWAEWFQASRRTYAARAAKAAARATEMKPRITEELIQATSFAISAETIGETLAVLRQIFPGYSSMLRCIWCSPSRPVTVDRSWRTLSVVGLAQTIYDERAFDKMPELGDALERGGCHDEAILNHCRKPGEHVRGCWVVDLVSGKE